MISLLFDGRALTATELGQAANVAPATASNHLHRLVTAGLLVCEKHGRHRYYRIANDRVADALEPLFNLVEPAALADRGTGRLTPIREARMCYDHLAGRLGVLVTQAMIQEGLLLTRGRDYELSRKGEAFCQGLGFKAAELRSKRRLFARQCLDWSERLPHLSGSLGAAIADVAFDRGWVQRSNRRRVIRVTTAGRKALRELLRIEF